MRTLAPIRVRGYERKPFHAACRLCADRIATTTWEWAMTWGLGHLSLKHPQWPVARDKSIWKSARVDPYLDLAKQAIASLQLDTDGKGKRPNE